MSNLIVGDGLIPHRFSRDQLTRRMVEKLADEEQLVRSAGDTLRTLRIFYNQNRNILQPELPLNRTHIRALEDVLYNGLMAITDEKNEVREAIDDREEDDDFALTDITELQSQRDAQRENLESRGNGLLDTITADQATEKMVDILDTEEQNIRRLGDAADMARSHYMQHPNIIKADFPFGSEANEQLDMIGKYAMVNADYIKEQKNNVVGAIMADRRSNQENQPQRANIQGSGVVFCI